MAGWQRSNGRRPAHSREWHRTMAIKWNEGDGCEVTELVAGTRVTCTRKATQVDHVRPHSAGGGDGVGNAQRICDFHHGPKSAQEGVQARGHGATRYRTPRTHPGLAVGSQ